MDTTTKWIIGVVVVVILGIGAYALLGNMGPKSDAYSAPAGVQIGGEGDVNTSPATTGGDSNPVTTGGGSGPATGATIMVVTYTDSGFSPASLTVTEGQTVQFVNKSTGGMWIASDPHPTHQGYDGTTRDVHCAPGYAGPAPFDECSTATTFSFTFTKTGSWGYHNHANDSAHGTIVVTPASSSSTN